MMKPGTRLLIRFTLLDGSMKSWGYDYPYYKTLDQLREAISNDFQDYPEHTDIHLFYDVNDDEITAANATELADIITDWLKTLGAYF